MYALIGIFLWWVPVYMSSLWHHCIKTQLCVSGQENKRCKTHKCGIVKSPNSAFHISKLLSQFLQNLYIFKPGAHQPKDSARLVSWNWFGQCISMCKCVCPPPRPLITSDVIWCDIDHVWLVKQVLQLFPFFSCFIWLFLSIKWMSVALVKQHIVNTCQ